MAVVSSIGIAREISAPWQQFLRDDVEIPQGRCATLYFELGSQDAIFG